jgi:hypothetical protein
VLQQPILLEQFSVRRVVLRGHDHSA